MDAHVLTLPLSGPVMLLCLLRLARERATPTTCSTRPSECSVVPGAVFRSLLTPLFRSYDTAYFALNSVRVYSDGSASATTTATVPAGASATASNTAGAATPTSGAVQRAAGGAAALVAVVLAVLVMV